MAITPASGPPTGLSATHGSASLWREARSVVALGLPIVTGLCTSALMGVTDSAILSPLGASALGAVSLTSSVALIFIAGLYGFLSPVAYLAARAFGAGSRSGVSAHYRAGRRLGLLAGLGSTGLMVLGLAALPRLGQPREVLDVVALYWLPTAAGLLPFALTLVHKQLLDAVDQPWLGVQVSALMVLANAALSLALVRGWGGLPRLGLMGAGIGSALAYLLGLACYAWLLGRRPALRAWFGAAAPDRRSALRDQAALGRPMGVQYLLETGATALAGVLIGLLGVTALAANQIATSVTMALYMVPLGLAAAVAIRLSQALGAGRPAALWTIAKAGLLVVSAWMGATSLLLGLFGAGIARLFTPDPAIVALSAALFLSLALMQVADGLQTVSLGALRGLLDSHWPTRVSLVCYWLIALPAAWVASQPLALGPPGVWLGYGLGLAVAAVALTQRLRARLAKPPSPSPVSCAP